MLTAAFACKVHAQAPPPAAKADAPPAAAKCLPAGNGYLRARLSGVLSTELNWGNEGTECTGAVRPTDGGIRMRFSRPEGGGKLVLVFGIAQLREGKSAHNLPVNVTLIREGAGQFFSTQGDDKCTLDAVTQDAIVGVPHRARSYRVTARGFCTKPARAVRGSGAVLLSRFDYSGRVDFESQDTQTDDILTAGKQ
ncbi:MAG TPA: hypothetical protein VH814_01605 [Steroidobacteraceae bacterium]|jgi:hypothetical protein